ncbi:hypothetical protein H310_02533 [Aphanomyces invadans]|uniref:Uncharacterized protein n=1 Tax=Aphanomyces invadans TaxID=157072 RepID=A0A024UIV6_9STRA|nr:hypothetical protein H310_02533 [Aphanomyces invadans]ETW06229.1 hypothetical protein H310_02533 [Aphanomyces invadans]|eukprot:XP_008864304.1 hypothetical protein H310_02533 [Aphanomyces invadans]
MGGGGGEIESYVQDFMVIQHDPLEEERNLQRQTERLLDRWHGLVLKGPENAVDLNSVEARIQRNIDRHEKMLAWLGSMERNLYEDTIAYEDACAMTSCGEQDDELRSYPNVVDESERILNQIDALLMDRQEWDLSSALSSLDMPSAATTPTTAQIPLYTA